MVKCLDAGLPVNQIEVDAVMFGMARHAVFSGSSFRKKIGMQAAMLRQSLANFRVAIKALELAGPK